MQPSPDQPAVKFMYVNAGASSVLCPGECAGPVFDTSSVLPDVVEAMVDWDVASPQQARALSFKCTPGYALHLFVNYRTPMRSTWQFGSRRYRQTEYRHFCGHAAHRHRHFAPERATRHDRGPPQA